LVVPQEVTASGASLAGGHQVLVRAIRVHEENLIAFVGRARCLKDQPLAVGRPIGLRVLAAMRQLVEPAQVGRLARRRRSRRHRHKNSHVHKLIASILWSVRRLSTLLLTLPLLAAAPAAFVEHTIASDLKGGYQVVAADLNHDGRPDLISLASGMSELVWYENPGWQRHVLAAGQSRMINCAVVGNEIVLASGFENEARNSAGIVSVLRPGADPREPWTVTEIDRLPTADIDGSGNLVVILAALTGAAATAPDYRDQTPLVYYVPGEWKRRVIST